MIEKTCSTFEREIKNPAFKKAFNESYKDFLISELLIAIMKSDHKTVRQLEKEVVLSEATIQKLRSKKFPAV